MAILGNFINRALVLPDKYFESKVPAVGELTDYDKVHAKRLRPCERWGRKITRTPSISVMLQRAAMDLARNGNKHLIQKPWKLAKTDMPRVSLLSWTYAIWCHLSIVSAPFPPFSMKKLMRCSHRTADWDRLGSTDRSAGHQLGDGNCCLEKIEDEVIEKQIQKLLDTKKASKQPTIRLTRFVPRPWRFRKARSALLVMVPEMEKVPKADKPLRFIDDGLVKRTIVSHVKMNKPEELIGKQVDSLPISNRASWKASNRKACCFFHENFDGVIVAPCRNAKSKPGSEVKWVF